MKLTSWPPTRIPQIAEPITGAPVQYFFNWLSALYNDVKALAATSPSGVTVTIVTAKLTPGGANGSMTFNNGILTAHTDAT